MCTALFFSLIFWHDISSDVSAVYGKLSAPDSVRHYCASYLHSQGIPDAYIMARGGWATPHVMNKVYRHAMKDKISTMEDKAVSSFQFAFQDESANVM